MKWFGELHIRHQNGYIDLHIPSKRREYLYVCVDWWRHLLKLAVGSSPRQKERWWWRHYWKSGVRITFT